MKKGVKITIIILSVVILAVAIVVYLKAKSKPIVGPVGPTKVKDLQSDFPMVGTVKTESTQLRVRKEAGEADGLTNSSTAINALNSGDNVTIAYLSENKAWGYVEEKGGWVSMNYIQLHSITGIFNTKETKL